MVFCGYTREEGKRAKFNCGLGLNIFGILLMGMFGLYFIAGALLNSNVLEKVVVSSSAAATELNKIQGPGDSWATTTYYVYNLTNPDAVITGAEPNFESVGPYVYWTFVGKAGATYNELTQTYSSYSRMNMVFQPSLSASHTAVITTLDFGYSNAFSKASPLTETTLTYMQSLGLAAGIHYSLAEAMVLTHYGADIASAIAGGSTQDAFLASKMATISANYGETIATLSDMAFAQWGGGAMIDDGNDLAGNPSAATFVDSPTWRATIAGALTLGSYLAPDQITTLTTAFSADAGYRGVGIYQHAQILGDNCTRLTVAKTKTIYGCFLDAENCGLVAIATMAVDMAAALTYFGLNATVAGDLCYANAIGSYVGLVAPLSTHFFRDRLYLEKGINSLLFTKKTAEQVLEGYDSSFLHASAMDPTVPSFVYKHETEDIAVALGTVMEVDGGASGLQNLNKVINHGGVNGFDYDGDGNITLIGDCYSGRSYPPNQASGSWVPYKTSYNVYDDGYNKCCPFEMDASETVSLGKYSTPVFYRNDTTCFATDAERATTDGYIDLNHSKLVILFSTPACMYGYTDKKLWTDDCVATKENHSTYTAIDSILGAPWKLQTNMQIVLGLDGLTSDGVPGYDINTQFDTTKRYPLFRVTTEMTLRGNDADILLTIYNRVFLLRDMLSWILTGVGAFLFVGSAALMATSVKKAGAVQPVSTEMKASA